MRLTHTPFLLILTTAAALLPTFGCTADGDDTDAGGGTPSPVADGGEPDTSEPMDAGHAADAGQAPMGPLPLTDDLCDDPANMDTLLASPVGNALLTSGTFNTEQVERMIAAPTEGPFYMFNLIRYREWAEYADGSETDLTGREANALYNPSSSSPPSVHGRSSVRRSTSKSTATTCFGTTSPSSSTPAPSRSSR
jgi:hypothetical protein